MSGPGSKDIAEYDNGAAPASPSREFIYGNGELLAMVSGGTTTYYQKDHLSVRMTSDASGNVLGQQGTYPFGELWYSSNGSSEWEFTTYQQDSETGLEYAMARYYDPRTATFCSADPVEGDPSDPESFNRYAYARNNPVILTDPSGQFWGFVVAFIVGAVLAAITGNPKFIPIVGVLGSIVFPIPGSTPPTFPGSGPTVTWKQLAIPGYVSNLMKFVNPTFPNVGSGGSANGSEGDTGTGANNGPQPGINKCKGKVVAAAHKVFGGTFAADGPFRWPDVPGGTVDVNLSADNLSAAQFNAVLPGRYPLHWWTYLTGIGATFHAVSGPGYWDPKAEPFTKINNEGLDLLPEN